MTLRDCFETIRQEFPKAIIISSIEDIKQNGLYLVFDGCESIDATADKAKFALVFAANSLDKDNFAAIDELREIRKKLFMAAAGQGEKWFSAMKSAKFEGSTLYLYALLFEIRIDIFI